MNRAACSLPISWLCLWTWSRVSLEQTKAWLFCGRESLCYPSANICMQIQRKNCWKIVDHRKQDCKSPQGIYWFISLLPWGDCSYRREAVLKYLKNLSHALCVFSISQEGFPDVSHCEGVLLGDVLLCCCTGQENDGGSAPKWALLLAQDPVPSAWASHWGAQQAQSVMIHPFPGNLFYVMVTL